ncbi:outer membrane porin GjpA [Mycobacterium sp. SMC-11]|uniref:outer membrane porin GjpA n=1 Tax=Mycobacterium sp. SMC-11 TaxID=3385969 RepID=UPI00390C5DC6
MHAILRPYATAGVVIAGTGLIAATPVVAPAPMAHTVIDVALTAGGGLPSLADPWIDVYNTAASNATTLLNNFLLAPGVAFQQMYANWMGYIQDFLDDPSSSTLAAINAELQQNWIAVRDGWSLPLDVAGTTSTIVTNHTMDGTITTGHSVLYNQVPGYLPPGTDVDMVNSILNWMISPASAVLMGSIGPGISPWIAMMNSIGEGDSFNEIIASMWNGFLNGATLHLDSLLPAINDAGFLPAGMSLDRLDFAFGGLLSTGEVKMTTYQVLGPNSEVLQSVPVVGGSLFNALGLEMVGVPSLGKIDVEGHGIGPIAAWETWSQTVGALLGSGWTGKNAVTVTPPWFGVEFPTIPDNFLDDGGASAQATDVFSGLDDLLSGLFS